MNRQTTACLILTTLLPMAPLAAGETVARWVDAEGITHYGNVQFAPTHAELQEVEPANAMDAPQVQPAVAASRGPTWSLISLPPKQNPKGWRSKGDRGRNGPVNPSR